MDSGTFFWGVSSPHSRGIRATRAPAPPLGRRAMSNHKPHGERGPQIVAGE